MPRSITIITNGYNSSIEGSRYLLAHLLAHWKRQGISIHETAGCRHVPADLAFMHVDTSVVPGEYLELGKRYDVAINGGVKDILKTSVSKHLLQENAAWDGPVIVKTNANYGGVNEFNIATTSGRITWYDPDTERPWRKREIMNSLQYPVFDSLRNVPQGVWKNDRLVVEKFRPERLANGDYRCRTCYFFGQQAFAAWLSAPVPVIKSSVATAIGVIDHIPESLRDIRKAYGIDYGKIDYTEVDGEVYVYDINKTPAYNAKIQRLISSRQLDVFADEIHAFN